VAHDVGERGGPPHQVVLVGAVRGALVVGVVLVELDRRGAGDGRGPFGRFGHDPLPRLVPDHHGQRVGAFGGGVLRVGVVDVQPGTVGQDDVGQAQVLVGELGRVRVLPGQIETTGV